MNKRIRKKRQPFEDALIRGMKQALAIARGEMLPARVRVVESHPDGSITRRELTQDEIREQYGKNAAGGE